MLITFLVEGGGGVCWIYHADHWAASWLSVELPWVGIYNASF